jgi:hypothetical protein
VGALPRRHLSFWLYTERIHFEIKLRRDLIDNFSSLTSPGSDEAFRCGDGWDRHSALGKEHAMSTTNYLPSTDDGLKAWAVPFSAKCTATPVPLGITAAIATVLATKLTTFSDALAEAQDPATRGPATVLAKDTAKDDLVGYIRSVVRQIQGTITVTNEQRQELGITLRDTEPSPIPPPAFAPKIDIVSVTLNVVKIHLHDAENPSRRGRPVGVDGAALFTFVGDEPPTTEAGWKFEGITTKTDRDVAFPSTVAPGSKVWFTAFWFNPTKESGPSAAAISTYLQGGSAMAA